MKVPNLNGKRSCVFCPVCRGLFINRFKGRCPHCGIGIAYKGEFFLDEDVVMDTSGISYRAIKRGEKFVLRKTTGADISYFIDVLFKNEIGT